MATSSFDKRFTVSDSAAIDKLNRGLSQPQKVTVPQRDYKEDSKKGILLLKQQLSVLQR